MAKMLEIVNLGEHECHQLNKDTKRRIELWSGYVAATQSRMDLER